MPARARSSDLLVCSHRGPYTYERSRNGLVAKRGGGGLVGSLAPVFEEVGGTWVAAALGNGDRQLAAEHPEGRVEDGFALRFLDLPKDVHHLHYDVVSNEYLWFLFHYLFDVPHVPVFDASFVTAWDAYRTVNKLYADAIIACGGSAVLVEDYHLMLAGSLVRRRSRSRRPLIYFHHTPWCEPDYFSLMPDAIVRELMESMLAYDVVGFHATAWANAFLRCCERFVPKASVGSDEVRWKGRATKILVAPVPIDQKRIRSELNDGRTAEWAQKHEEVSAGRKILLRVDRIDLSKNPLRGFLAFEQLLEARPSLADEVVFLALLYPSRLTVERYQRYYTECLGVVRRVNERFGKSRPDPISLSFEDDYHRSLAAMTLYDALLVNPVFDGLNLVCKEGAFANERAGTVILSRNAGVFEEVAPAVTPLNPFDVNATADAIERALATSQDTRDRTARKLKRLATRSTPAEWLEAQLAAARV